MIRAILLGVGVVYLGGAVVSFVRSRSTKPKPLQIPTDPYQQQILAVDAVDALMWPVLLTRDLRHLK